MNSAVFPQTIQGHEHWTYECPPPPLGCNYRSPFYTRTRESAEDHYADHRRTHRIPAQEGSA